jgi:hypothetical protein
MQKSSVTAHFIRLCHIDDGVVTDEYPSVVLVANRCGHVVGNRLASKTGMADIEPESIPINNRRDALQRVRGLVVGTLLEFEKTLLILPFCEWSTSIDWISITSDTSGFMQEVY